MVTLPPLRRCNHGGINLGKVKWQLRRSESYPKHHNALKVTLFIVVNWLKIQGFYSKFTSLSLKIVVKVIFQSMIIERAQVLS